MMKWNQYQKHVSTKCILLTSSSSYKGNQPMTRLCVVFDASGKTPNNTSLNDILKIGPTIQRDLVSILLFLVFLFLHLTQSIGLSRSQCLSQFFIQQGWAINLQVISFYFSFYFQLFLLSIISAFWCYLMSCYTVKRILKHCK